MHEATSINSVGVIISDIFFDCDPRNLQTRDREQDTQIRHFQDGRSTSERDTHCAAKYNSDNSNYVSGGVGSTPARLDAPGQHQASGGVAGSPTIAAQHPLVYSLRDRMHSQKISSTGSDECRLCGERRNIRLHSFFKRNFPLGKLMWLLFSWATEIAMQDVMWHLNISNHTVIDWYNFVRDVCAIDIRNHPLPLGGFDNNGSPIVVEIDELFLASEVSPRQGERW